MKGNLVRTLCLRSLSAHALVAGVVAGASTLPTLWAQAQFAPHPQAAHLPTYTAMPQGSFLHKPSSNVSALVQQVKSDPLVAIRYSRLFHLPVKMVPLAFEQLHLTTLKSDHILQVHFVRSAATQYENSGTHQKNSQTKEDLVFKPRRVRAGTSVYCLPDGTPLLMRVCGNPIRTRVAPEFYTKIPVPDFDAGEKLLPVPASIPANDDMQTRVFPLPTTPLPVISVVAAENVLSITALPLAPAMTPAALRTASLPPVYHWAHNYNGLLGGLAGAPLFGLFSDFGSGRGSVAGLPAFPIGGIALLPTAGTPILPVSGTPTLPIAGTPVLPTSPGLPLTPVKGGSGSFSPSAVPEPGALMMGLASLFGAGWLVYKRTPRY